MPMTMSAALVTYDMGHKLQFRITRERNWLKKIRGIAILCVFIYEAHKNKSWLMLTCAVAAVVGLIADVVHSNETQLEVNPEMMIAKGSLGFASTNQIELRMSDITELSYSAEAEDGDSGLYAHLGWRSTCILPHVSEQQAMDVRNLILSRFPALCEQMSTDSMLSGKHNQILTLGLSGNR